LAETRYQAARRVQKTLRGLALFFACAIAAGAVILGATLKRRGGAERASLTEAWQAGQYEEVYRAAGEELEARPLDCFLLSLRGFAAYQLAVAQVNTAGARRYVDECVEALRKALLSPEGEKDGRIHYVLGKAYYYKGPAWADQAAEFLEAARNAGFDAADIPQYLGLSYALLHDYLRSVEAFSEALAPAPEEPSDLLLLGIARSYIELGEADQARAYLARCLETTRDYVVQSDARMLLGRLLSDEGDLTGAEAQYRAVLEESGEMAEARFQLGELYALRGDATRARAEWRRARQIDPAYEPALARLKITM